MSRTLLVHSLIRQTAILVARLALTDKNIDLRGIEELWFLNLVHELKALGMSHNVIADMFGMPVPTYYQRRKRAQANAQSEASRARQGLRTQLLGVIREQGPVQKAQILTHFPLEDEKVIVSLLKHLQKHGWIARKGRAYVLEQDVDEPAIDASETTQALVWVMVFRHGPIGAGKLETILSMRRGAIAEALDALLELGQIVAQEIDGEEVYSTEQFVIGQEHFEGWEAAVFDHYHAMIHAVCTKLAPDRDMGADHAVVGGSTYTLGVWDGHPLEGRIVDFFEDIRTRARQLRTSIEAHNEALDASPPKASQSRLKTFIFYVGQTVFYPER